MSERTPLTSPQTSHDAASQLDGLGQRLDDARNIAEKQAMLRDRFEQMYRKASAKALMRNEVRDLKSEDRRKAAVQDWTLEDDERHDAAKLAETMGLPGTVPDTIGDLRWLRDRAGSLADSYSAKAYDARQLVSAWTVVASMAKFERELGQVGMRGAA